MTIDEKICFEWLNRGEIVRVQNENVVTIEKTKFKTKIIRGKKEVK